MHRILTRLQNPFSRTACHSHNYFLFFFVVNFTMAAMRAHLHSVDRCVSQQRQRQCTGLNHRCTDQSDAWSQICSWYRSLPATVSKTPRCESVPTCMNKLESLGLFWLGTVSVVPVLVGHSLCCASFIHSRTAYPGVMPALRKC